MATKRYAMLFETLQFFGGVHFHSIRVDGIFKLNVLMFILYTHTHTLLDDIKWRLKLMRFCSKSSLSFPPIFHCSATSLAARCHTTDFVLKRNSVNHYLSLNENTCAHAQSHFCQQNCGALQCLLHKATATLFIYILVNEWHLIPISFYCLCNLIFETLLKYGAIERVEWMSGKFMVCFQIIFHTMKIVFLVCMCSWCLFLGPVCV